MARIDARALLDQIRRDLEVPAPDRIVQRRGAQIVALVDIAAPRHFLLDAVQFAGADGVMQIGGSYWHAQKTAGKAG